MSIIKSSISNPKHERFNSDIFDHCLLLGPEESCRYLGNYTILRTYKKKFDFLKPEILFQSGKKDNYGNEVEFLYNNADQNMYSIPKAILSHTIRDYSIKDPSEPNVFIDCLLFMISGNHVAMGCYIHGKLVAHKCLNIYVVRGGGKTQSRHESRSGTCGSAGSNLRRHNEQFMKSEVKKYLESWKNYLESVTVIYYQGSVENKSLLRQTLDKYNLPIEKFSFDAGKPGYTSLKEAYNRLLVPNSHGKIENYLQDVLDDKIFLKKYKVETPCSFISSIKSERRLEKQKYPSLHPELKENLHDSIAQNDYEALMDLYENHNVKQEFIDYLSEVHPKLGSQTFLHYAVKNNLDETTKALLEIGSDPRVKDREGKVPYAYADSEMCEIFMNFRLENPSRYNWTKCHIPAPMIIEEVHRKKLVEDLDAHRRKRKEHRKMKKESRKISD